YQQPNLDLILARLPATVELAAAALLIAIILGVPIGMLAAFNETRPPDRFSSWVVLVAQSLPLFWLGLVLIDVFAVRLRWFPAAGAEHPSSVVLPAISLSAFLLAQIAR